MKKKLQDCKKRIAFPIQIFSESEPYALPTEIHIVPTGKWDHPVYGEMVITSANISTFVQNFNSKVRKDICITAGHDNGMSGGELPAVGWFTEVIDRGVNGLYGVVEWTEEGKKLLSQKAYKYFSPEFYEQYEDPETHTKHNHVLVGGALTNSPYFKELDAVVKFSEPSIINQFKFTDIMNKADILAKKASGETLSAEEVAFLKAATDLTDEEKATVKTELEADEAEGSDEDGEEDGKTEEKTEEGKPADGQAPVNASDKNKGGKHVLITAAEHALLKTQADNGQKAFNELQSMKMDTKISKLTFSAQNKSGRFAPSQTKAVKDFMITLSEVQLSQFENIVNQMPKAEIFGELGADKGNSSKSALSELREAVAKKIKEFSDANPGKKLSYSQAVSKIESENPDLVKRYNEELEEGGSNE